MHGNSNWSNYGRYNHSRDIHVNNQGTSRSHISSGSRNIDNRLPFPHTSSTNRQKTEGNHNAHSKYYKSKSFAYHRLTPYDRPHHSKSRGFQRHYSYDSNISAQHGLSNLAFKEVTPLEAKVDRLINAVKSQNGIEGQLVFLQTELDNPTVVLQNAVQSLKHCALVIKPKENQVFELSINGKTLSEGTFQNKQLAKSALYEMAVVDLRKKCFYIIKKRNYEEISTEDISKTKTDILPSNTMEGSKAHLMMLKMGWGGKGLGSNEQGSEKTVAETLIQNVTKAGLGEKNVMNEIHNILEKFAASTKVTTLAFDSGFTKEERAHIHTLAAKFNLKSKSEGKDENRRITISKKIAKWDLVRELLLVNGENDSYTLIIPSKFESIWKTQ